MDKLWVGYRGTDGPDVVLTIAPFDTPTNVISEVRVAYGEVPADLNDETRLALRMTEEERWVGAVIGSDFARPDGLVLA